MKLKRNILAAAAIGGLFAQPLSAQQGEFDIWTGNGYLRHCGQDITAENAFRIGICVGYLDGWLSRDGASQQERLVCRPPKVSNGQVLDIVLKYLKDNPEKRHLHTDFALFNALSSAFPCPTDD